MHLPTKTKKAIPDKNHAPAPIEKTWDSFFLSDDKLSDDFMQERASQEQPEREAFLNPSETAETPPRIS